MEKITPVAHSDAAPRFLQWSPIILGALAATALSSVLLTFAVTIGLGVTSTAPTWRDASAALAILSGLYLIIQAVLSFGLGGYIAGHTRISTGPATVEETEHVDGAHGLGTWALAVVMGAIVAALIGTATINRTSSIRSSAQASAAEPLLSYELDRMFRAGRRAPKVDLSAERAEAGRILLTTSPKPCLMSRLSSLLGRRVNSRESAELLSRISLRPVGSCHPTIARRAHSLPRYFEPMTFHRRSRRLRR
jgi:hypothetical protein